MAYTNKSFESPVAFPDGRSVFYGPATDGEGITADIGDVPRYSFYFSSNGTSFFFKARAGDDANCWDKLSAAVVTPETDKELFAAAMALSAAYAKKTERLRSKAASVALGAAIIVETDLLRVKTATASLGAALTALRTRINMGPVIGVEAALTAECTPVKNPA